MEMRLQSVFDKTKNMYGIVLLTVIIMITALLMGCSANGTTEETPDATEVTTASISEDVSASPEISFEDLVNLIGKSRDELLTSISETPVSIDEGGLGFDQTGIRAWFDENDAVAQIAILSDQIDVNGIKIGDTLSNFKSVFGEPISDTNSDAHFEYENIFLSVNYDASTDKIAAVYILDENF